MQTIKKIAPLLLSLLLSTASAASYDPVSAPCPSESLVRDASGLSDNEEAYRVARKAVADQALKTWLTKTNSGFGTAELPTVRTSL
jgi:lysophospholipase